MIGAAENQERSWPDRDPRSNAGCPYTYWVFGRPVSVGSDESRKPRALARWREQVKAALAASIAEASDGRGFILIEDLVDIRIYWMSTNPTDPSQPDLDNVLKPFIDAFNGTVIADDRQVHRIIAEKFDIISPPAAINDIVDDIQGDARYGSLGEVTIARLASYSPEDEDRVR